MPQETKEMRFKRVAERRTRIVLRYLRIVGNCGNRGNYAYLESDFKKIFSEIEQGVKEAKAKYSFPQKKEFKL